MPLQTKVGKPLKSFRHGVWEVKEHNNGWCPELFLGFLPFIVSSQLDLLWFFIILSFECCNTDGIGSNASMCKRFEFRNPIYPFMTWISIFLFYICLWCWGDHDNNKNWNQVGVCIWVSRHMIQGNPIQGRWRRERKRTQDLWRKQLGGLFIWHQCQATTGESWPGLLRWKPLIHGLPFIALTVVITAAAANGTTVGFLVLWWLLLLQLAF